jgi:hypothetical protein
MRARRIIPPTPYTMRFPSSFTSKRRHHMSPLVPSDIAHSRGSDQSACVGRVTTVPGHRATDWGITEKRPCVYIIANTVWESELLERHNPQWRKTFG